MREVLWVSEWDANDRPLVWSRQAFDTHASAILFADGMMRGGRTRDEVDVHDEDGSMNVRLPLSTVVRSDLLRRTQVVAPETKHSRDCAYVVNDLPAPCTCTAGAQQ